MAARGLIRDGMGILVSGFSRNIGHSSSIAAELWGLSDVLKLALSLNLLGIEVETDAQLRSPD